MEIKKKLLLLIPLIRRRRRRRKSISRPLEYYLIIFEGKHRERKEEIEIRTTAKVVKGMDWIGLELKMKMKKLKVSAAR